MAALDPSRTALELDEVELTAANLLLTAPTDPLLETAKARQAVAQLERAGIAENGVIGGYPARLLQVILAPVLRVVVERFAGGGTQRDVAAATDEAGVWGESRAHGRTEFTPIEPSLIPWAVARTVGLGPRERAAWDGPIELSASALETALSFLAAGEPERADEELAASTSLDDDGRAVLVALLVQRRLSWRTVSVWEDGAGEQHMSSIAVVDGGDGGLWFSEHLHTDRDDPTIRLRPADPSDVWDQIVASTSFQIDVSEAEPHRE